MNLVILMGRPMGDPEIRYSREGKAIGRFSIAVDRRYKREGQPSADFFTCVCFGKIAEFVEKYIHKGTKIVVQGQIQNNNYENSAGEKVYGNQIMCENIEFAESKKAASKNDDAPKSDTPKTQNDNFMDVPSNLEDEELPFN